MSPQAASSQSVASEAVSDTTTRAADPIKNVLDEAHKLLKGMNLEEEGQDRAIDLGATLKKLNQAWEKGGPGLRAVKIARVQQGPRRTAGFWGHACAEAQTPRERPSAIPPSEGDVGCWRSTRYPNDRGGDVGPQ